MMIFDDDDDDDFCMETRRDMVTYKEKAFDREHTIIKVTFLLAVWKFSAHTYFRMKNSNLSSIFL